MISPDKLIINAAITGCVLRKSDNPYLPVTIPEIVDCARAVQDAGASIVHLHARGPDQSRGMARFTPNWSIGCARPAMISLSACR
jgi:uncharacterized protein (DUF849 family)